ncbi:caveolin-1-like, partial [Saccoglossus kowalevskii]|uniref:Caveolin n=1 Tax=Saccoglossus kowalevskii TaxID=10224 RepID=A0ABM0MQ13_SACKO
VAFEDIFAEPDSTHSSDYVWGSSFRCFNKSKTCCYNCLSTVCAVPCAVYWGLVFACTIFWQIWFIVPSLRLLAINMWAVGKQNSLYVHALCDPWCESCGRLFSQIKVHVLKD